MQFDWLTNDPKAAKAFKRADARLAKDREAAKSLPLAAKIEALRAAKTRHEAAYRKIMSNT